MKLNDVHRAHIEWLVDPGDKAPAYKHAAEIGVSPKTLKNSEADADFKAAWDARLFELGYTPDHKAQMMEALRLQGLGGNVKAAELWLKLGGLLRRSHARCRSRRRTRPH